MSNCVRPGHSFPDTVSKTQYTRLALYYDLILSDQFRAPQQEPNSSTTQQPQHPQRHSWLETHALSHCRVTALTPCISQPPPSTTTFDGCSPPLHPTAGAQRTSLTAATARTAAGAAAGAIISIRRHAGDCRCAAGWRHSAPLCRTAREPRTGWCGGSWCGVEAVGVEAGAATGLWCSCMTLMGSLRVSRRPTHGVRHNHTHIHPTHRWSTCCSVAQTPQLARVRARLQLSSSPCVETSSQAAASARAGV